MCGITGALWSHPDSAISPETLRRMTEAIRHRGPDDGQTHLELDRRDGEGRLASVALGFRRLSIIDLEGARQPMANEDGSVWMVFNGEVYNFRELRRRLEGAGHRFATDGDGETILHLYEDLGTDCFALLNGMFAVAIWDSRRNRLVLARDRVGKKPLFHAQQGDRLLFASELKCFAEVPGFDPEIEPAAIDEYLTYQYIPHPRTIWKGVGKLPPGHFATFQAGEFKVQRYWDFDPSYEANWSHSEAVGRVRELLEDSVRLRLRSDVPLGAFLSGGIDSSLIVALAQGQLDRPIRTFSIGFPDRDFDETHHAAEVARFVGSDHTRFEVSPDGVAIIDRLAWHYDEPFGDSSAVPTWYLSELTRGKVAVALSGDGGDELFAGYDRYRALWLTQKIQRWCPLHRMPGISLVQRLPDSSRQRSPTRRLKRFLEALGQPLVRRYLSWLQIFPETLRASLYQDQFIRRLPGEDPFEFLRQAWERSGERDVVTKASLADLLTYLPCDLMTKVDIASMAHGLEVRCPMLDYRLVELAASLPVGMKFRGRRGKLILQDAFANRIPATIWKRPKMGFGVPIAGWFRDQLKPMVHDLLLSPDARVHEFFRPEVLGRLVTEHESLRHNHGYRLWNLLMLEKWLRTWTRSPGIPGVCSDRA
ncbi:MAG: asparagine synthase (glutamine-hydrolyzing) [Planctomycetaceae bacterium]|nr:MAG: asparagine synthase (glutamine-hydrolyzing) [Planctomycetaceae bacterium]